MVAIDQIIIRILLSVILSGLVGIERERLKRPAGIRTHMLVGVGATLVILTSIHLADIYDVIQVDRMGSQVISGIGFLGAGTIIQQGNTVQGLTTAAGLWAVACIGLAVGAGFHFGAITATFIVLVTLVAFKRLETQIMKMDKYLDINISAENNHDQIEKIFRILEDMKIVISEIEFIEKSHTKDKELITIEMSLKLPDCKIKNDVINEIISQEGIVRVSKKLGGKF